MSINAFLQGVAPYNAVSEKWSKVLLKNLSLVGVYKHIAVDHSSELSDNSDAIHLRMVNDSSVSVANYYTRSSTSVTVTAAGAMSGTAGTEGTITYGTAAVDDYVLQLTETPATAVKFEDYALKTADVSFQAKIIERGLYALSKFVDTFVMNTIIAAAGTTLAPFNATTAAAGDMYDILLQAAAVLKKAGAVPVSNVSDLAGDQGIKETGYVVVNPDVMRFILKEPAFVKVDMTDKSALWKDGVVRGTIAGLVVLESSNMPTTTNVCTIFAGIKSASHFAIKKISDRMIPAQNQFQMLWSVLTSCGCVVSHPSAIVKCAITVA
jgi:hypothetical protein